MKKAEAGEEPEGGTAGTHGYVVAGRGAEKGAFLAGTAFSRRLPV